MIIGITGKAGSGKDTVANYLVKNHDFIKLSFAGILKQGMQILFNLSDDQLHHPVVKEKIDPRWGKSPRELMQWLGTDILRKNIRPDFFIVHLETQIEKNKGLNIVISDIRFEDEAELIKRHQGILLQLVRPHHLGTKKKHISENLKIKTDYQINNNQGITELHKNINQILK